MTTTGNIITRTYGQNTFTFNVGAINLAGKKLIQNWKNL